MIVDRRAFIAGTALVVVAPAIGLLPAPAASPAPSAPTIGWPVFMIEGWSAQDDSPKDDQLWVRVDRSWRTAWR